MKRKQSELLNTTTATYLNIIKPVSKIKSKVHYDCTNCGSLPVNQFSKSKINQYDRAKILSITCNTCTTTAVNKDEREKSGAKKLRLYQEKEDNKEIAVAVKSKKLDPSALYESNPLDTPVINDAKEYFKSKAIEFKINIGKLKGWRTISKLAVRGKVDYSSSNGDITKKISTSIGLFQPGTHNVIRCLESDAHHPSINICGKMIEKVCKNLNIHGYIEGSGFEEQKTFLYKSYLKYIIMAVERKTHKVQLSIVWNTVPKGNIDGDDLLNKLVEALSKIEIQVPCIDISSGSSSSSGANNGSSTANAISISSNNNDGNNSSSKISSSSNNNNISNDSNSEIDNSIKTPLFHSIWVNYNPSSRYSNAITSHDNDSWYLLYGKSHIKEKVKTDMVHCPKLRFPPLVFRQANIDAFGNIVQNIRNWIKKFIIDNKKLLAIDSVDKNNGINNDDKNENNQKNNNCNNNDSDDNEDNNNDNNNDNPTPTPLINCIELYAGVGTIGLNCLDLFNSLHCSDENPHNKINFDATLSKLKKYKNKAIYESKSASEICNKNGLKSYDIVIVDPPRKGLDDDVIQGLLKHYPENSDISDRERYRNKKKNISINRVNNLRLIYVSCGFKAFKRDVARLTGEDYNLNLNNFNQNENGYNTSSNNYNNGSSGNINNSDNNNENDNNNNSNNNNSNNNNSGNNNNNNTSIRYWKLIHAEGHVLFPGSDHIETFAVFDRMI